MTTEELVPHNGIACPCPGTPHAEGDTVFLYPKLAFVDAVVVLRKLELASADGADPQEIGAVLMDGYLQRGIAKWTFLDEDGPRPVNRTTIAEFSAANLMLAVQIADHADDLYSHALIDPLQAKSSRTTPTAKSTSPRRSTSPKPRKK